MAFAADSTTHDDGTANKRVVTGTFSGGIPSGTIETGLTSITHAECGGSGPISAAAGILTLVSSIAAVTAAATALEATYVSPELDDEAKKITALNATNTAINLIGAKFDALLTALSQSTGYWKAEGY